MGTIFFLVATLQNAYVCAATNHYLSKSTSNRYFYIALIVLGRKLDYVENGFLSYFYHKNVIYFIRNQWAILYKAHWLNGEY